MSSKAKFKCKDCTKRYVGCHSICKDYISAKARATALNEDILRTKDIEYCLNKLSYDHAKQKWSSR